MIDVNEMVERAEQIALELVGDWSLLSDARCREVVERHGDDDRAALEELVKRILQAAIDGIQNHFEAEDYWTV